MKRKDKAYERVHKYCEICKRVTTQIVEPLVTFCTKCETTFEDDGDDIINDTGKVVK